MRSTTSRGTQNDISRRCSDGDVFAVLFQCRDTSVIPPGTTSNGMIVLGFLDSADGTNEHLDLSEYSVHDMS